MIPLVHTLLVAGVQWKSARAKQGLRKLVYTLYHPMSWKFALQGLPQPELA